MRLPFVASALFATATALASPVVHAAMYKCTSPDGTIAFQAAPCPGAATQENAEVRLTAGGTTVAGRVQVTQDVQLRAVADREETQRRDRCRSYREAIDRQSEQLTSGSESAKHKAAREVANQERKAQQDRC
jgi:hypothetical protein